MPNPKPRKPSEPGSELERALLFQVRALRLPAPELQWRFHPVRQWRFDLCWPVRLVAVECEGATWTYGRHVRGLGFERDCEKMAEALILGWKVLRVTGAMIDDGRAATYLQRLLTIQDCA